MTGSLIKEILSYAKRKVELIYCGKMPNHHFLPQEQINDILVSQAKMGKYVVRLKGGDPCIFGRGGEEAAHCHEHGITFEFVPGITSGIAAPMYAGIPVTHRDYSSSVTLVTGHKRSGNHDDIPWEHLAKGADTLVFYMGLSNLATITTRLAHYGRPLNTPVALVELGTTSTQKTVTGTLETIINVASTSRIASPAIIVVGEVVHLREQLAWFDKEDASLFEEKSIG